MTPKPVSPSPRLAADERKEFILEAAIAEFAQHGLHGGSTERIANQVGISQPYIFKLFGSKKNVFLASVDRVCSRIQAAFADTLTESEESSKPPLKRMALAYVPLLEHRDELLMLLHGFAAAGDPEIQQAVRERYAELYSFVKTATQASDAEVRSFFARGMLMTIAAALDFPELGQLEFG